MADRNGYIGRAPADTSVTIARQTNQPTGVTTTFVFNSGYNVGYLDVYVNGSKLVNAIEYVATDTQNVSLTTPIGNGDKVEFVAYKAFNLSNIVSSTLANLTVNGDIASQNINSSGIVTATTFVGAVTGNVTGNATGLSGTPNISCGTGAFSGAVTLQDNLDLQDDDKILLGTGDDLEIYHSGTYNRSYIQATGTNHDLTIAGDQITLGNSALSETLANFNADGAAELYYDGSKKLDTKSDGVDITGELQCDTLDVDGVGDISGFLTLHGGAQVNNDFTFDGQTAGRDIRFDRSEDALEFEDNAKAMFGTGQDLQIYHDASNSIIADTGTGHLRLAGGQVHIMNQAMSTYGARFYDSGAAELYHNGTKKFETSSAGVTVTGTLNATTDVQINGKGAATTGKAIAMSMVFG